MRKLALCLALFLLLPACKKSVKGETSRWKTANQTVDELAVQYPGFKTALEEQRAKAKTAMDVAEKVEDEDKRIKQMASANNMLTGGFVGQLKDADTKIKKLRDQLIEVAGSGKTETDKAKAKAASKEVQRTLDEVGRTLSRGAPSASNAATVLRTVTGELRRAEQNLDKIARADKKADKATGTTTAAKPDKTKPPAKKQWKCEYCDTMNQHDHGKCSNCNAARPVAGK